MGAGAALSGNRFAPGLPTKPKPMPADLHRSFPPQVSLLPSTPCYDRSKPLRPPAVTSGVLCDGETHPSGHRC